jgi:transposase-like protein
MGGIRKKHEPALKARVALEALKGEKTLSELSSEYGVHATQITQWKRELVERSTELFARPDNTMAKQHEETVDKLHKAIGEITMENNWLKKKLQILG